MYHTAYIFSWIAETKRVEGYGKHGKRFWMMMMMMMMERKNIWADPQEGEEKALLRRSLEECFGDGDDEDDDSSFLFLYLCGMYVAPSMFFCKRVRFDPIQSISIN